MMQAILKREVILDKTACRIIGIAIFVTLTALGAFVRIPLPFSPVPITLQTLFVLLSGAFLGGNLGTITQISYVTLGIIGLPIFTNAGSGLLYLAGPTGGYLFGFILANLFIGKYLKYQNDNLVYTFGLLFLADLVLLGCGLIWLKVLFGYSFKKLLLIGVIPFIPGDLFKAYLASILYLKTKSRLKEIL